MQIGGLVTLEPLLRRETAAGGDSLYAERTDKHLSPLPRMGEGAAGFFPPAPNTSSGQYQHGSRDEAVGQEALGAAPTSSSGLSDEGTSRHGDKLTTRDGSGDSDSGVTAAAENCRGRRSGGTAGEGLRPTDTQLTYREKEEEHQRQYLRDVTPEERALSLPSSSVLAADGSGELGLAGRSARWGRAQSGDVKGKGKNEGGTVWSKRWVPGV